MSQALLALVMGLAGALLANRLADVLPPGSEDSRQMMRRPSVRPILHYLTLPWYFFRRGVCPHCGERRPLRAPLLDAAMLIVFGLVAWRFSAEPLRMALYWADAWFLLTVLVIDLEHRLVPNVLTLPAAVLAGAGSFLPGAPTPAAALLGGAIAFGAFLLIALAGRGAMGMGDVKLAGVIGLMAGFPLLLPALLAGVILGGLAAALLLALRRATRKTAIAYAPYLSVGALVVLVLLQK